MKYKISEKRKEFLTEKFFEYTFKNETLDIETLNTITEPIELDFLAKNHNWDDGDELLIKIVENPNCDIGTAKLIFWRADIESFLSMKDSSDNEELIRNILEKFEQGSFKNQRIFYNPEEDPAANYFDPENLKNINLKTLLFSKPKGRLVEPTFLDHLKERKIKNVQITKTEKKITISFKNHEVVFQYLPSYQLEAEDQIISFVNKFKFPDHLQKSYGISELKFKQNVELPKLIINKADISIVMFLFNSKPLQQPGFITHVNTILRNDFYFIQAIIKLLSIEEEFEKIRRKRHNNYWCASSKIFEFENPVNQKSLFAKALYWEIDNFLCSFFIISQNFETLKSFDTDEILQNLALK